ncbi:ABC transporter ATP-binding protein (plasmid) [Lactiplantibacillus plantarum]|nr:ABC transporter ATP-binding protein [Lactiplantibacillus plantarum]MYV32327.1 ABC transporter ATP-binding protein [Lactiplantibacillus plantarum]QFY67139.1 ABC transporter ATP-binding protein [Lactiplantibacillus plantarum]
MVNTILKEADLFCPNSVRINFTIYHLSRISCKIALPIPINQQDNQ